MTATMDLHPFKSMVKERCGLCFEAEKAATLGDGIRTRMAERGIATDAEYLACLLGDEDEFHRLVNLLTINETYFFREPAHLDLLTDKLFHAILAAKKPGDPVRVLCAGCATGEEPYSLMMKFLEKYGAGTRGLISIIGADIDSDALCKAEQGVYGGFAFREFPAAVRDKYFEKNASDRYAVRPLVKERVRFLRLNLMSDAYPEELHGVNAIFYRNVSIYFEPETQKRIFNKLAALLPDKGWLFVSSTETLSHNHGALTLVEHDGVFCYQKNAEVDIAERRRPQPERPAARKTAPARPSVHRHAPRPAERTAPPAIAAKPQARKDRPLLSEALACAEHKQYDEALACIEQLLAQDPGLQKASMLKAGVLINLKRLEDAEAVCLQALAQDAWCLEGHLLLGLIAKLQDREDQAYKRFKDAVYIQPSCWLAHFYLAEIYRSRGDAKGAGREYEIVIRLLRQGDLHGHGLTFFPLAFPVEQMLHLCQHNLHKLQGAKV